MAQSWGSFFRSAPRLVEPPELVEARLRAEEARLEGARQAEEEKQRRADIAWQWRVEEREATKEAEADASTRLRLANDFNAWFLPKQAEISASDPDQVEQKMNEALEEWMPKAAAMGQDSQEKFEAAIQLRYAPFFTEAIAGQRKAATDARAGQIAESQSRITAGLQQAAMLAVSDDPDTRTIGLGQFEQLDADQAALIRMMPASQRSAAKAKWQLQADTARTDAWLLSEAQAGRFEQAVRLARSHKDQIPGAEPGVRWSEGLTVNQFDEIVSRRRREIVGMLEVEDKLDARQRAAQAAIDADNIEQYRNQSLKGQDAIALADADGRSETFKTALQAKINDDKKVWADAEEARMAGFAKAHEQVNVETALPWIRAMTTAEEIRQGKSEVRMLRLKGNLTEEAESVLTAELESQTERIREVRDERQVRFDAAVKSWYTVAGQASLYSQLTGKQQAKVAWIDRHRPLLNEIHARAGGGPEATRLLNGFVDAVLLGSWERGPGALAGEGAFTPDLPETPNIAQVGTAGYDQISVARYNGPLNMLKTGKLTAYITDEEFLTLMPPSSLGPNPGEGFQPIYEEGRLNTGKTLKRLEAAVGEARAEEWWGREIEPRLGMAKLFRGGAALIEAALETERQNNQLTEEEWRALRSVQPPPSPTPARQTTPVGRRRRRRNQGRR